MALDMLQSIIGGPQQTQYQDLAQRYDQGAPWDGISDNEAYQRHAEIAQAIPPDMYANAAEQSFSRLTPQQRVQLGQYLQQQAPQYGVSFPDANMNGRDDRLEDPAYLAQMTGQIQQQQPGLLGQILGGSGGGGMSGMLASPIARAALAGIATMAMRQVTGSRRG